MKLSDELSAKVIKPVIDSLSSPLTYIINLSFNEGTFPSELKIAQIIPLYKNDDPNLTFTHQCHFSLSFLNYLKGLCIIDL